MGHDHKFYPLPSGRMSLGTPAGSIEVSNYPVGDRVCSLCGFSDKPTWVELVMKAAKRDLHNRRRREDIGLWLWYVVGFFEAVNLTNDHG